jgi:site-specific DNA-methyltransferase (adenine-specific)
LIKSYSNEGDTVLDFTMGSGTTGLAFKNTGRKFIGVEKDKEIFDIACKRLGILDTDD